MSPASSSANPSIELLHLQTQLAFEVPRDRVLTRIGKHHDQQPLDIDLSGLPNADIVSRLHLQIYCDGSDYSIEDVGSSNGTFLNGERLQAQQHYPLSSGDRLDLGQGGKMTFVVQQRSSKSATVTVVPDEDVIQSSVLEPSSKRQGDRASRFLGVILMVAGIIILASATHIGIFFSTQAIILWLGGIALLFQRRVHPDWGWLLIALGVGIALLSGNMFASTNLLQLLMASALFAGGYQLYTRGKLPDLF